MMVQREETIKGWNFTSTPDLATPVVSGKIADLFHTIEEDDDDKGDSNEEAKEEAKEEEEVMRRTRNFADSKNNLPKKS